MLFTGVACAVLLGMNLLPVVTTTPSEMLAAINATYEQSSIGQPPIGVRGATWLLSILAVLISGLIIASVVLAVSGVRLRSGSARALRTGAIAVGVLMFAFVAIGFVGVLGALFAPGSALVSILLAGPAMLLGWVIALMAKARDDVGPEPEIGDVRPATFQVPIGPGELPGPG